MHALDDRGRLEQLEAELVALRHALLTAECERSEEILAADPRHRRSAANLVHYLELRRHDIRDLQARLAQLGLSSLGRAESHVLATVEAVLAVVCRLLGHEPPEPMAAVAMDEGHTLLAANADRLLGPTSDHRATRIMVTLAGEMADQPATLARMVDSGMDLARINCAHDDAEVWARLVHHLRARPSRDARPCRIAMDLGGPKLRTGPLEPGRPVLRVRPRRDALGEVVSPALVWLTAGPALPPQDAAVVPVTDPAWLRRRRAGDRVEFRDARGARRRWRVLEVAPGGCLAAGQQTCYLTPGTALACRGDHGDDTVSVGDLPEHEQAHTVATGDHIVLTRTLDPAPPTPPGSVHHIGCTLPAVFDHARPGHRVWLDDGKIGGTIVAVTSETIDIEVTDAPPGGTKLRAAKGINLPATDLQIGALTDQDLEDLSFVARNADLVSLSFVRHPADIEQLRGALARLGAGQLGVVLKIETQGAFENLPELLLTAMCSPDVGVMIARGDLAVEVGFERLAEVQEEILWACEAAHVPVIWATQVLDTLARTGQPSRAEVTDAAMGERAECVMLNKGPHIEDAIIALDSILTRMHHHQHKKRSLLRRLRAWDHDPR